MSAASTTTTSGFFDEEKDIIYYSNNSSHADHQLYETNETTYEMEQQDELPPYSVFFDFVIPGIFLNFVGLLGLLGNVLSIIVLSRPQMRSSINCILIGLASFDSILILTSILMFGLPAVHAYTTEWFSNYFYNIFPYITPVVYPVGMIAQTGSVYLTMCVTVERYVAVCLPLRARVICTFGRARAYVATIGMFALLYNLPRFWEVTHVTKNIREHDINTTWNYNITLVEPTDLRNDYYYINVYVNGLYLVIMYIVPFGCLAVFNLLIYLEVRRANSERNKLTKLQNKEITLAKMLMVVVVVFFVCNILALVVNILEVLSINIDALNNTSNLLVTFNSSVNLIIYCIFGHKFKKIFFKMFCPANCVPIQNDNEYLTRYPESQYRRCPTQSVIRGRARGRFENEAAAAGTIEGIEEQCYQLTPLRQEDAKCRPRPESDKDFEEDLTYLSTSSGQRTLKESFSTCNRLPYILTMRNGNAETGDIFKISNQKTTTGMSKDDQKINIQNSPLNQKQNQNLHELYVTGEKNDITITVNINTCAPPTSTELDVNNKFDIQNGKTDKFDIHNGKMENLLERSSADGSSTSSSGGRGSQLSFPYIDGDNN